MISPEQLRELVERASTLTERMSDAFTFDAEPTREAQLTARIDRWRRLVAGGNEELFQQRLALDGLTTGDIRRMLGRPRLRADAPLPAWTTTLSVALADQTETGGAADRSMDSARPLPMEEALLPFIRVARAHMATHSHAALLSAAAHGAFEQDLLHTLTDVCSNSMVQEFFAFRAAQQSPLERGLAGKRTPPRHLYLRWLERMSTGGLTEFLQRFPVAGRLCATATDRWVAATAEFLDQLGADRSDIQALFDPGSELGVVVTALAGLSDPHSGGRSVAILTFASGRKVVYKPRELALEARWAALTEWANAHGAEPQLRSLRVLSRERHGWVEFAEHQPVASEAEAARYYQRAGMMLALMHALGTIDLHDQNLVASGEQPMLIDLEMLVSHYERPLNAVGVEQTAFSMADQMLSDTVLSIGMLPRWVFGPDGISQDVSALGAGTSAQHTLDKLPLWQHPNTDDMRMVREHAQLMPQKSVVMLGERALSPVDYDNELITGFRTMYGLLLRERASLVGPDGPLTNLEDETVRFIFRFTREYMLTLLASYNRTFLSDGGDRSIALDTPSRSIVENEVLHAWWPLRRAEAAALEQMDVPWFGTWGGSRSLPLHEHGVVHECFGVSAAGRARARIAALSPEDRDRQVSFIRSTLHLRVATEPTPHAIVDQGTVPSLDASAIAPNALIARAIAIGRELVASAVRSPQGGASWIAVQFFPQARRYEMHPLGSALYSGAAGVALFFAALWRVTGDDEWRTWVLEALQPLRSDVQKNPRGLASLGIGGADGIGSIVYTLALLGQWTGDASMIDDARSAAAVIDNGLITADTQLDVMSGCAGAALGLLALHDVTGDASLIATASACTNRILALSEFPEPGTRAWLTFRQLPMAGLSHGAAGIAAALLRVHRVAPDDVLPRAAAEAVAHERMLYSPELGNWPRLGVDTPDGSPAIWTSWCHGAPGILLARLMGLDVLDTPEVRRDIDDALTTTRRQPAQNVDQLCCGNLGRADILLEAGRQLGRAELVDDARAIALACLSKAEVEGVYQLLPGLPKDILFPGFFQGSAGIGYALLRQARPGLLPCVLAWRS